MITAPIPREQLRRVALAFVERTYDVREQLADYLDSVAAQSGDAYYAGLADGVRLGTRITPTSSDWN